MSPSPKLSAEAKGRVEDYIEVLDAMRDDEDDLEGGLTAGDLEILFALHDRVTDEALSYRQDMTSPGAQPLDLH